MKRRPVCLILFFAVLFCVSPAVAEAPRPRCQAEIEEMEGVILRWDGFFHDGADGLYAELIREITDVAKVFVFAGSEEEERTVIGKLGENGIELDERIVFYRWDLDPFSDPWVRDYGPTFYEKGRRLGAIDMGFRIHTSAFDLFPTYFWQFYRERLPANGYIVGTTNLDPAGGSHYDVGELFLDGGNYMTNGDGVFISTSDPRPDTLSAVEESNVNVTFDTVFGGTLYTVGGSGHIDMKVKILNSETVLVGEYRDSSHPFYGENHDVVEGMNGAIRNIIHPLTGRPLRTVRIPMPRLQNYVWVEEEEEGSEEIRGDSSGSNMSGGTVPGAGGTPSEEEPSGPGGKAWQSLPPEANGLSTKPEALDAANKPGTARLRSIEDLRRAAEKALRYVEENRETLGEIKAEMLAGFLRQARAERIAVSEVPRGASVTLEGRLGTCTLRVYSYDATYTNALIVNGKVLVPVYGVREDEEALRVYRDAMPGYEVVGIDCSVPIKAGGAIHCLTHEIPAILPPNRVRPILPEGVITTRRPVFRWERPEGIESQYLILREGTETEHTPVVFAGFLAEEADSFTPDEPLDWGKTYNWRLQTRIGADRALSRKMVFKTASPIRSLPLPPSYKGKEPKISDAARKRKGFIEPSRKPFP